MFEWYWGNAQISPLSEKYRNRLKTITRTITRRGGIVASPAGGLPLSTNTTDAMLAILTNSTEAASSGGERSERDAGFRRVSRLRGLDTHLFIAFR